MEYTIYDLELWNKKIEKIAKQMGLDYYEQEFEFINYKEMLGYEAYMGMPSRYPHWSFGKAYEKNRLLYKYNLTGLPYEMVINSNPCIAYLMKENTLLLQILTIAHVYGHNDFFKNNRLFKQGTRAEYTLEMFKNNADRIRNYVNDPSIGYENVEKILNSAHAVKLQIARTVGEKRISDEEIKNNMMESFKQESNNQSSILPYKNKELPDLSKLPIEPEEDLLYFIARYGELSEWEKNVLDVVREETLYFIPQIETKIMNEGWASYWHYNILKELELPEGLYMEFIKRHNDVITPLMGRINPYYLGFEIFKDIEGRYGRDKIFEVRAVERDSSFIRRYLTKELCMELNLFEYAKRGNDYFIEEVPDEVGWENIRNTISDSCGMGMVPYIKVVDVSKKDKTLLLEHVFDGRELHVDYAEAVLKHIVDLWRHPVHLKTSIGGKEIKLICDESKKIIKV